MRFLLLVVAVSTNIGVAHAQGAPTPPKAPVYYEFQVDSMARFAPGSPMPTYPPTLKAAGVSGEVLASFVVDTAGNVDPATFKVLKSTDPLFTAAVADALPQMRFRPAMVGGRAVRQLVQLPFAFSVKEGSSN